MSWKGLHHKGTEPLFADEWNTVVDALDELHESYGEIMSTLEKFKPPVALFVSNGLNQDTTVVVKGNASQTTKGAVPLGVTLTVKAGGTAFATLTPYTTGWLPYIYVEVRCSTAPTSGSITVLLVRTATSQDKLVDALEIRDTNTHSPDTDPDKVKILQW